MISIIIPIYNSEKYLYDCLNSILKQTYSDFEVICIDDYSADKSLEILKYFKRKDSRITILKNSKNKGVSYTRNKGLEYAKGDYIFFLDSDDWITLNSLKELYENAKFNDSDIVFYKLARMNKKEFILNQPAFDLSIHFDKNTNFNNFTFTYKDIQQNIMNTSFTPCLKLYKKSFLDKYPDLIFPEGIVYEDVLFHIKTILRASKISFVPKFFYVYTIDNQKSIIHDSSKIFDIFKIIDLVEEFLVENNYFNELKFEFYSFKILQILQYLNKTHNEEYFKITKEKFEEMNNIITENIQNKIKNQYISYWENYLNVISSDNINEYIDKCKK